MESSLSVLEHWQHHNLRQDQTKNVSGPSSKGLIRSDGGDHVSGFRDFMQLWEKRFERWGIKL